MLSEHTLDGVMRAWNNPYFRARYEAGKRPLGLARLRAHATIVTPITTMRGIGEDLLEDDLVLVTAVAGQASSS